MCKMYPVVTPKASICSYPLIAKMLELLDILTFRPSNHLVFYIFNIFLENQAYPNTNYYDTTCMSIDDQFKLVHFGCN